MILSEMAGAAKELGEAIIVNPNDKEDVARALKDAITMPEEEQVERNRVMQRRLQRYDIMRWASDFIDRLSQVKKAQRELCARRLTSKDRKKLLHDYSRAGRRLILLDYDGTLVPFAEKPERAKPDEAVSYTHLTLPTILLV